MRTGREYKRWVKLCAVKLLGGTIDIWDFSRRSVFALHPFGNHEDCLNAGERRTMENMEGALKSSGEEIILIVTVDPCIIT